MKEWKILSINNIDDIESLTENKVKKYAYITKENFKKGFNLYIVDFGGYFGKSCLIFSNNHYLAGGKNKQLYYANDYQLHHSNIKSTYQLIKYYFERARYKIFTDEEILKEPVKNYNDYRNKIEFIHNYLPQAFDYLSIFGIGKADQIAFNRRKHFYPYYSGVAFAYFKEKEICDYLSCLEKDLEQKYWDMIEDKEQFRKAIARELSNHEACISMDYEEALSSLGLKFENLTEEKQKIVIEELKKQVHDYCC